MSLTLLSTVMADDDRLYRIRQGFWLRVAREDRGLKQEAAAEHVGLKTKAAISDYETGVTQVPLPRLRRLADLYGWPLALFTEPEPTAAEQARERMARLARAAIRLADRDADAEAGAAAHGDDGSPAGEPRRQSA